MVKKTAKSRTRRNIHGDGFFSDIWSGLKKGFKFVKDNKLLSKGLALVPHPIAQTGAKVAQTVGLGKKRKGKAQSGRGTSKGVLIMPGDVRAVNGTRKLKL